MQKKYHFDEVAIIPKPTELSTRSEVNLNVSYITKHSRRKISGVPVIVANMDTVGTIDMAKKLNKYNMFVALDKFIIESHIINFFVYERKQSEHSFITSGVDTDILDNIISAIKQLRLDFKPNICLDVANGYMYSFLDTIKKVRDKYPESIIMAGNVCTPEGVENIIKAGADIVKAGIAQGGLCNTKTKAGINYPQFSVAQECGQAANELNALCCSDGGVKSPADICKALAAGSHFVMAGSIFMGYQECNAIWRLIHTKKQTNNPDFENDKLEMLGYGMSSEVANKKYFGGLKFYRTSEGLEKWIRFKGDIEFLVQDIKGGLASCCTYTNTKNLENLKKNVEFIIT